MCYEVLLIQTFLPICDYFWTVIDEAEIAMAIQSDAKNIDRLAERFYNRDYSRLGLGTLTGTSARSRSEAFRITMVNINYTVSRRWGSCHAHTQAIYRALWKTWGGVSNRCHINSWIAFLLSKMEIFSSDLTVTEISDHCMHKRIF